MQEQSFLNVLQQWSEPFAALFFFGLIAFAILSLVGFFISLSQKKQKKQLEEEKKSLSLLLKEEELANAQLEGQLQPYETLKTNFIQLNESKNLVENELNKLKATSELEQTHLNEKISKFQEDKENFKSEFEALSQQVLGAQRKQISESTNEQVTSLLTPLKEQITAFENRINTVHTEDVKGRTGLLSEIGNLKELNQQINQEAMNLTQALKSESKARGMWGELILEQVLQSSGLRKGEEYDTQVHFIDDKKKKLIPDAIVHLPDDKQLIVDSKVTLNHFEQWVNAADETSKQTAEKLFVQSTQARVKELADKDYSEVVGQKAMDMVIMFVPIESAFQMLLQNHSNIFADALAKNVIIASPTTLLANLRVIEKLWNTQKQSENAYKIAEQAGKLYDKLALYLASFEEIGKKLTSTQKAFETSRTRLMHGNGNAMKLASDLKKMGINSKKSLPEPVEDEVSLLIENQSDSASDNENKA